MKRRAYGFRSFTNHGGRWHHNDVPEFLNGHMQSDALPWPKPPDDECLVILNIRSGLICQWSEKVESATGRVNGIREMPDPKCLIERRPVGCIIFGKLHFNRPSLLSSLLQIRGFSFEGMPCDIERTMICEDRKQLPSLYLGSKIDPQILNFIGN